MDKLTEAMRMFENGQTNDALKILQNLEKNATDETTFDMATLYQQYGFFEEAIKLLEGLHKKYPDEGQILVLLASLYIELEQDDLSIHLLNQINNTDDFYGQSLLLQADIYQSQGLFEVSEQKLLEAKEELPDELVVDFVLGEILFSIGQYKRDIHFYEKVLQKEKEINIIDIYERLVESQASLGNYEQALALYYELNSGHPDALFKHGIVAKQIKNNVKAIQVWEKLRKLDPHYYTVYEELSQAMLDEGMVDEAYEVVQEGLAYDEYNKMLYLIGGKLAIKLSKLDEAVSMLKEAIALDNDFKDAIILLLKLLDDENNFAEMIILLNGLKESGSEDPHYDWELAKAYIEEEKYDKALKSFDEAYTFLTHDSDFLLEFGYFLLEEGYMDRAINVFKLYQKLEPLDEEINDLLGRIKLSNESE